MRKLTGALRFCLGSVWVNVGRLILHNHLSDDFLSRPEGRSYRKCKYQTQVVIPTESAITKRGHLTTIEK